MCCTRRLQLTRGRHGSSPRALASPENNCDGIIQAFRFRLLLIIVHLLACLLALMDIGLYELVRGMMVCCLNHLPSYRWRLTAERDRRLASGPALLGARRGSHGSGPGAAGADHVVVRRGYQGPRRRALRPLVTFHEARMCRCRVEARPHPCRYPCRSYSYRKTPAAALPPGGYLRELLPVKRMKRTTVIDAVALF